MTDNPREPEQLEYLPQEHVQVILEVEGGGRMTQHIARLISPPLKLLIGAFAHVHSQLRRHGRPE